MTHTLPQPLALPALSPRHRRALGVALVLALGLHAALLLRWSLPNQLVRAGASVGTVSTRMIAPPAPPSLPVAPEEPAPEPVVEPITPPPTPEARPAPRPKPKPAQRTRPAPAKAPAPVTPPSALGAADGSLDPRASLLAPPPMGDFGGSRSSTPVKASLEGEDAEHALQFARTGEPVPASLPRGATLEYKAQGQLNGDTVSSTFTLAWRRTDDVYEADWESTSPALAALRMASVGLLAPQGLLPVEAGPRTGGAEPARFDYAERSVHFAASGQSAALRPGSQDELSAIIQLGAWLSGDAARFEPGQTFEMPVAHGDTVRRVRWFVDAQEAITALGNKPVQAIKLSRLPLGGTDLTGSAKLEVWLAEALDYLPLRLRWSWPDGQAVDAVVSTARLNRTATETGSPQPAPAER